MQSTRKKKLGGYPALGVVTSITLALFVLGLFGTLIIYSNQFGKIVRDNLNVKVFLKSTLTETQRNQLERTIGSKQFVAKGDNAITFVSKEEAEKDLIKQIGDYKEILGENPLKDAFIVKVATEFQDTTSLRKVKSELENMNGVLEATYEKHLFDEVNKNFTKISIALLILAVLLMVVTFLLVNSTLRIALFSQRFLIRSMQLVGAKKWFIQWPFLFRAISYGFLSSILASALLWGFSTYAQQKITDLSLLHNQEHFLALLMILSVMGIIVATVSTFFAIHKYLKMSLDELY
ncbi:permease-like cell division protein FtsX [Chryseolinea sp. H1M3-3]|uniref:cell division protein FtsX n=1 Tax=Chryseolinea sp. H1M3-3 TaxID=3034144 RepID=UPI0023EDA3E0|nr:permease-like cell division protein FtsX [Chryseolinea sp. H1M3-3]